MNVRAKEHEREVNFLPLNTSRNFCVETKTLKMCENVMQRKERTKIGKIISSSLPSASLTINLFKLKIFVRSFVCLIKFLNNILFINYINIY